MDKTAFRHGYLASLPTRTWGETDTNIATGRDGSSDGVAFLSAMEGTGQSWLLLVEKLSSACQNLAASTLHIDLQQGWKPIWRLSSREIIIQSDNLYFDLIYMLPELGLLGLRRVQRGKSRKATVLNVFGEEDFTFCITDGLRTNRDPVPSNLGYVSLKQAEVARGGFKCIYPTLTVTETVKPLSG